ISHIVRRNNAEEKTNDDSCTLAWSEAIMMSVNGSLLGESSSDGRGEWNKGEDKENPSQFANR
ncbi:hypothetical protein, partial [Paenibacillus sp. OSY-SE]|uniref:hypothetical protein n=1 Tax=Paenibacillus sp. OSY-SE TaxID=1196323 RepID=UPI0005625225